MHRRRWLGPALLALGAGVAATAVLGPLVLGVLQHRTSDTTLNQLLGADAAGLLVVAPVSVAVAVLAWRRHPAAPVLALAPAVYALYTFAQIIVGQEYLRLPGNIEQFFPLLLAVFVLGGTIAVGAWTAVDPDRLPAPSRRLERIAAGALLIVAAFLVFGLHLPMLPDALSDQPTRVEYVSSPTPFWLVKLMDLGIVVPAAIATGLALLRRRAGARKAMYAILGGYTLIGTSVAAMALIMLANGDPDASVGLAVAFTTFAGVFLGLTVALYRPLFHRVPAGGPGSSGPTADGRGHADTAAPRHAASVSCHPGGGQTRSQSRSMTTSTPKAASATPIHPRTRPTRPRSSE